MTDARLPSSDNISRYVYILKIISALLSNNGCRIYVDIMAGKNCPKFSMLTWNSFFGQFVHPVGVVGNRGKGREGRNRYFSPIS